MYSVTSLSPRTVRVFDCIGGYIVEQFYNHLYKKAKIMHNESRFTSITEAFRYICTIYLQQFGSKKGSKQLFSKTINGMYEYFMACSEIRVTRSEWIVDVVEKFMPKQYFELLTSEQIDFALGDITQKSFMEFAKYILTPAGTKIIIDRRTKDNVDMLQCKAIDIVNDQRISLCAKINKLKSSQIQSKTYSTEYIDTLKNEYKKIHSKLQAQTSECQRLQTENSSLETEFEKIKKEKNFLIKLIKQLKTKLYSAQSITRMVTPTPVPTASPIPSHDICHDIGHDILSISDINVSENVVGDIDIKSSVDTLIEDDITPIEPSQLLEPVQEPVQEPDITREFISPVIEPSLFADEVNTTVVIPGKLPDALSKLVSDIKQSSKDKDMKDKAKSYLSKYNIIESSEDIPYDKNMLP